MKQKLLDYIAHRNAPLPEGPWGMYQNWQNLMCMHIPVKPEELSPHVPDDLELDIYDGYAWISVFTFKVQGLQLRILPKFPYLHHFLEVNVRTYVKHQSIPGVYFFSLDAAKTIPVLGARLGTLPYFKAKMKAVKKDGWTHYSSCRQHGAKAYFKGRYKSVSEPGFPSTGSLDYWLFERYYLFNTVKGAVTQIGIHHLPWKPAKASVVYDKHGINSLLPGDIEGAPTHAHYVESLDVLFWPLKKN
ncbi:YqjF family protein [Salinicoccus sp. HZC-1]|uniref:YqjF family protein n=1 Tax=Salinicoccus sp. HZC-1 TaxID=3385497 RepID=UPI00398AB10F